MNILVSLEGVLSSDSKDPCRAGALLYYGLKTHSRVAIFTAWDRADAENWLAVHGFVGFDELIDNTYEMIGDELAKRQITVARSRQAVELIVSADPTLCAWSFEQGIPSLVFAHPDAMGIGNRPDVPKQVRKWGDIESVITKRNIQRSKDVHKGELPPLFDLG